MPGKNSPSQRLVYSEFGNTQAEALTRAVPDRSPTEQKIKVQASRKGRKGKTVTVLSGFQHNPETLTKLGKELKKVCGTGGTVKDNEIEIQGDHSLKLVEILVKKGYQAKRSGGK